MTATPSRDHGKKWWALARQTEIEAPGPATTYRAVPAAGILWVCVAIGVALVVYVRTLAPTVYGLDSAELSTGAYVLGIVHPPGSPLFLLVGHLFTWLPLGDIGYRLNLFSATAAALAIGFVYAILCRLTGRRLLALAGAWFLAFSYYFWVTAVAAELYAPHLCIVGALIWLALVWRASQQSWQLCVFTFLFGLGMGNHLSLIVLLPGFAWLVFAEIPVWRRPGLLAAAAVCGLLGLSIYLYLPLRDGATMNYARQLGANVTTWSGFWWMVSGRAFAGAFLAVPPGEFLLGVVRYPYLLWSNFLGLGCLFGLIGLLDDFNRRPTIHIALFLMFVGHLLFFLSYNVPDRELMLAPSYLIWGLWTTLGVEPGLRALFRTVGLAHPPSAAVMLLAMSIANLVHTFPFADISADRSARQQGESIFAVLPEDATYIATWTDAPVLEYLQLVEAQRPDVEVLNVFFFKGDRRRELLEKLHRKTHPVYTSAAKYFSHSYFEDAHVTFEDIPACNCRRVLPPLDDAALNLTPEPGSGT